MDKKLIISAFSKFFLGVILVGALLFVPAGTLQYKEAWLFLAVLFIPMFIVGIILMFKDPDLLRSRLNAKEKVGTQKKIVGFSGLMFLVAFILAGLNCRFGWNSLPEGVIYGAVAVFLIAYLLYGEVLRENSYLSRTIEVREGQTVVDTGLYGIVRHPMYMATIFLFLSIPFILNSLYSFFVMLLYIPVIIKRLLNEEEFLKKELPGYEEYMQKVKYRIIPFIY
ncbi:MAG: isoprenylcysteine carboxylmethyltransferase family protein [Erysipelotrichaceae bacterium]|nr:isoprenylcysteine carboxylmethyltransferase family protein [Erysipelotrichaceae bacterium]